MKKIISQIEYLGLSLKKEIIKFSIINFAIICIFTVYGIFMKKPVFFGIGPGFAVIFTILFLTRYDSMIAKIICWGKTREEARKRMLRAISEYVILGVETTIPFHKKILRNKSFIQNTYSTKFIEEEMMKVEV